MKIKLAQYGISHDHASGKAKVMGESDEVDFCGVFEPSEETRAALGAHSVYEGVHWFSSVEEMLEDEAIVGIAVQGKVSQNLAFARQIIEHGKHVWIDKPAGDDLDAFRAVLNIAREKGLLVQLGYMFRYNAGFQFIFDCVESGKLGEIFSVRARISSGPSSEKEWQRWDARGEREGGIMFILACHVIDAVVTLLGRPIALPVFRAATTTNFLSTATIQRPFSNMRRRWRRSSRRRWRFRRALRGVWKSMARAAVRFWSLLNRRHCACVWTKTGTAIAKVGRTCRWKTVRVMSRACARLSPIFAVRKRRTARSTTSWQYRRRYCGRRG